MRLRQIALVAGELAPVRAQLLALLGLEQDFKDVQVAQFGLENSVMAIGDTYLEVVSPVQPDTTAGRLLKRRGGDGGYMVIMQTGDIAVEHARIKELGVRIVWQADLADAKAIHLHPRDVGGAIASIDQMIPPESWRWAGPGWQSRGASLVEEIVAVELQADDPATLAQRWGEVCGSSVSANGNRVTIALDQGAIHFVEDANGRGSGVSAVYFRTGDFTAIAARAQQLGLEVGDNRVRVCGTDFYFVS